MDQSGSGNSTLALSANQSVASLAGASTSVVNLGANRLTAGTASGTTTFAGSIGGTGGLTKDGGSTQILSGTNTYSGITTVSAGTLLVNGSNTGTGAVSVSANATLGGTGSVAGDVTANGIIAPGDLNAIGTFGVKSLNLVNTLAIRWDGTAGTIDKLNVTGLLELQNTSSVVFSSLGGSLTQSAYIFATYGTLSSTFGTVTNLPAGYTINARYGGNNRALVAVPEPATWVLMAIGVTVVATIRRRKRFQ